MPILWFIQSTSNPQMTPAEALGKAVAHAGSMQKLAKHLGVTKGAVSQWKLAGRQIPLRHCPSIERLTAGDVQCEELRSDVDWSAIRTGVTKDDVAQCRPDESPGDGCFASRPARRQSDQLPPPKPQNDH